MTRRLFALIAGPGVLVAKPRVRAWTVITEDFEHNICATPSLGATSEDATRAAVRELVANGFDAMNGRVLAVLEGTPEVIIDGHFAVEYANHTGGAR